MDVVEKNLTKLETLQANQLAIYKCVCGVQT